MTGNGGITCGSVTVHGPLYAITCEEDVLLDMPALALAAGPMLPEESDGLDAMVNNLAHLGGALHELVMTVAL